MVGGRAQRAGSDGMRLDGTGPGAVGALGTYMTDMSCFVLLGSQHLPFGEWL